MRRIRLDEDWSKPVTDEQMSKRFRRYYREFRRLYPHIPEKLDVKFKRNLGSLADVWMDRVEEQTNMRFEAKLTWYKLFVREFLHEMVHVIWPKTKHGPRFEERMFLLRKQLFADNMVIF